MDEEDDKWHYAPDVELICRQLVSKYEIFEHINVDRILMLYREGSAPTHDLYTTVARTYSIRYPYKMLNPDRRYLYIIVAYESTYYALGEKAQALILFHELKHIGEPFDGRRLYYHTVEDFRSMLESLGLAWVETPEEGLPDIVNDRMETTYGKLFRER